MNIEQLAEDEFLKSKRRRRRSASRRARRKSAVIASRNRGRQKRASRKISRRIKKNSRSLQRGKKPRYSIRRTILNPFNNISRVRRIVRRSIRKPYKSIASKRVLSKPGRFYKRPKRKPVHIRDVPTRPMVRKTAIKPIRTSNLNYKIRPLNARRVGIRPVQTLDRRPGKRIIRTAVKNLKPVKISQIKTDHIGRSPGRRIDQPFGRSAVNKKVISKSPMSDSSKGKQVAKGSIRSQSPLTNSNTMKARPVSSLNNVNKVNTKSAPIAAGKSDLQATDQQSPKNTNRSKYLLIGGLALITLAVGYGAFRYFNSPVVSIE